MAIAGPDIVAQIRLEDTELRTALARSEGNISQSTYRMGRKLVEPAKEFLKHFQDDSVRRALYQTEVAVGQSVARMNNTMQRVGGGMVGGGGAGMGGGFAGGDFLYGSSKARKGLNIASQAAYLAGSEAGQAAFQVASVSTSVIAFGAALTGVVPPLGAVAIGLAALSLIVNSSIEPIARWLAGMGEMEAEEAKGAEARKFRQAAADKYEIEQRTARDKLALLSGTKSVEQIEREGMTREGMLPGEIDDILVKRAKVERREQWAKSDEATAKFELEQSEAPYKMRMEEEKNRGVAIDRETEIEQRRRSETRAYYITSRKAAAEHLALRLGLIKPSQILGPTGEPDYMMKQMLELEEKADEMEKADAFGGTRVGGTKLSSAFRFGGGGGGIIGTNSPQEKANVKLDNIHELLKGIAKDIPAVAQLLVSGVG